MPNSIRWRLSLTYAGIALLTALALGLALLAILRGYYAQREQEYLLGNARTISVAMAKLAGYEDLPAGFVQSQVDSFAFLSQARVRVTEPDGRPIADSGTPKERSVISLSAAPADVVNTKPALIRGTGPEDSALLEAPIAFTMVAAPPVAEAPGEGVPLPGVAVVRRDALAGSPQAVLTLVPGVRTLYGFDMAAGERAPAGPRSDQAVSEPLYDAEGRLRGFVELSEGPAYGRDIVASVAWGWALAGSAATLLAAGVGWLVSRRISSPLLALEAATSRMAAGDLSARAEASRRDEFGALARSFNQMATQVEKTVTALRRFVADAAHELHTPLTALHTNLELAATMADEEERVETIRRAQAQVERLERLTNSLLDLSRAEVSSHGERAVLDLALLLRETSELYASRAEQRGVDFGLALESETLAVRGDEGQIRRLLGNLLDNALKFTPEGGEITLGLGRRGGEALLWIADSGIGIPAEDLPLLFGRFHRGRNAARYPGSGLGLAIVKAIAEGHGGRVEAASDGRGTRLSCFLPLHR